jgi:hypothetical protein
VSGREQAAFGSASSADDLVRALTECGLAATEVGDRLHVDAAADDQRLVVLAFAHAWAVTEDDSTDSTTVLVALS